MHLSYVHRGEIFWYGVDAMLSILLLCLLLGPTGRAFSVDRWLQRKWQKNGTSDSFDQPAWTANFSIRMVQLHWCLVYLSSGLSKLQGESWWDGSAVLQTFMLNDMSDVDFRWIGTFSDTTISLFSTAGVFLTLAYEISFTFLIWNPTLRPPLLTCAVLLHGGVAIVMGLPAFSALMVIGCLAFVSTGTLSLDCLRSPRRQPANHNRATITSGYQSLLMLVVHRSDGVNDGLERL